MTHQYSRRSMLAVSSLALGACGRDNEDYFGNTKPPSRQRLVFENNAEPETLDPAKTQIGSEYTLLPSLFEGLVSCHPAMLEPLAGIATHCEASSDFTRFVFYLRGHPSPRGYRFSDVRSVLANRVSPAAVPLDSIPAVWSDGSVVTAHDFVFSWRRVLKPETAAGVGAPYLYYIERGRDINLGKASPEMLGVAAPDEFTLDVRLERPAPFLPDLLWLPWFCPVPARVLEIARGAGSEARWIQPSNIVVNGPFTLAEWRPNNSILLRKNPQYHDSAAVLLEELMVLPTREEQTMVNLYKAGYSHAMQGHLLSPRTLPALQHKRDLLRAAAARTAFYSFNCSQPPFDNLLVRYALNMAIDKKPIAAYLAGGQKPAAGFVPPMRSFPVLTSLPVTVDGQSYDVLSYNPSGARDLMTKAGYPGGIDNNGKRLSFMLTCNQRPRSGKTAEILQRQWRENLGIEVRLANVTVGIWVEMLINKNYAGIVEDAWSAFYLDPNDFLSLFVAPGNTGSTWLDPQFDAKLERANSHPDRASRMEQLADCEKYVMRSMPIVPLYFDSYSYLQKPFARDLWMSPGGVVFFKYGWVDNSWRPA